jgi:hypothetical protein
MAIIMHELADGAEEAFLHERAEAEKEDEIASDEDLDNLKMEME